MRLDEIPIPDGAEERAWQVVRAAFDERMPAPRRRSWRPLALVAAAAAVAVAAVSPPGRAVLDSLRETVGVERAQPALFSLPASGRLLVSSSSGAWVVDAGGGKRRLGDWREASWSPFGRFVVASRRNELAALEPDGDVRWTLARRAAHGARWGGTRTDTRIAYLSGSSLRVVAGDGTGDRRVARGVAVAPAWRPGAAHVLAYLRSGILRVIDVDRGRRLWPPRPAPGATALEWVADRLLVLAPGRLRVYDAAGKQVAGVTGRFAEAALGPGARSLAVVRTAAGTSSVDVVSRDGAARRVFAGAGTLADVAWSPDGRWLLVTWRDADQWVFVRVRGGLRIRAVSDVARQFDSGRFPRVATWCCSR
jgi:hypothetical protein